MRKSPAVRSLVFAASLLLQLDLKKRKTMKRFLPLTSLVLVAMVGPRPAPAQTSVAVWTNLYDGPGNYDDQPYAIAVDASGNVFVTGVVDGDSSYDFATIKYSGAGVPLWINLYNGPEDESDSAKAMAADGSGNVIVTGTSIGSGTYYDFATIKYSGTGEPLWTNRYSGPGSYDDGAKAVAVDPNGNVFVTGASYSTNAVPYNYDYATIKYSNTGEPLWTNRYNGPGNGDDRANAVAVDGSGNVIVTGNPVTLKYSGAGVPLWTNYNTIQVTAMALDGNNNVIVTGSSIGSGCNPDYATIKYSAAGVPLWTNRYNGPANDYDEATGVAVDRSGNVIVTGGSDGDGFGYDYVYATIKYSGAGVPLWTNRYSETGDGQDTAYAVAVDDSGNVFVTGTSIGSGSGHDCATIKYSGAGVPLWTNRYNGTGNAYDQANAVAVDASGNVFVTGSSYESGSFSYDYVTIKYASAPLLTIAHPATDTVALSWPSPWTDFTLQENTNGIATVNWSNVLTAPTDNGTTKTVIVNPPDGNRFFRLKSQ